MTTYAHNKETKVEVLGTISFKGVLVGKKINYKNLPFVQKFITKKTGFKNPLLAEILVGQGYFSLNVAASRHKWGRLVVITASKEPKNLKLDDLQPNDLVKIVKIPLKIGEQIVAAIDIKNLGEDKATTLVRLTEGAALVYKGYYPEHFNDHLFSLPGVLGKVDVWVGDSDLKQCEFSKV